MGYPPPYKHLRMPSLEEYWDSVGIEKVKEIREYMRARLDDGSRSKQDLTAIDHYLVGHRGSLE